MPAHKLWSRRLRDGAQVRAVLEYDAGTGATITLTVRSAHAEDQVGLALADALRAQLDREGATPLVAGPEAA
jgi:hypothetical protein